MGSRRRSKACTLQHLQRWEEGESILLTVSGRTRLHRPEIDEIDRKWAREGGPPIASSPQSDCFSSQSREWSSEMESAMDGSSKHLSSPIRPVRGFETGP
ncbi:hypothetical protein JCGZ_03892 [Jatropha curcas]|uniref:Uncharacterized protein n=1 Tax=Jatropha curcas TaxID=180498 RepID=A0A067LR49_JATCU|nr:hypothetical protein JCGZ_03892 [Jatropha curcas]